MKASDLVSQIVDHEIATILATESISGPINITGCTVSAFQTPAAMTGNLVQFQGSIDKGKTFKMIKTQLGAPEEYTVDVDGIYPLDRNFFHPFDQIKIVTAPQDNNIQIMIKPSVMA